jgi:signal transduction histidine kinase
MEQKRNVYIFIILSVTFLFTLGNILLTYRNLNLLHQEDLLVDHTNQVQLALRDIYIDIINIESGGRGYILSGQEIYLQPYHDAVSEAEDHLNSVRELTVDNAEQLKNVETLRKQINEKIAYISELNTLRKNKGFEKAKELFDAGKGNALMLNVKNTVEAMLEEENRLLFMRENETSIGYQTVYVTTAIAGLLNLGFVVLAYYLTKKELSRRDEFERNKDQFISMASHELKTPITSLKLFLHILDKQLTAKDFSGGKKFIRKTQEQADKLTKLSSDLLDVTRMYTGKMNIEREIIDLQKIIDDVVDPIQGLTKKHTISVKGKTKVTVLADRQKIYQVLSNLLTNAMKYSPNGGDIVIRTLVRSSYVRVEITDHGIGIDKRYHHKIFERMYRVSEPKEQTFPGLGIGLYVCSEIIKLHGGRIWVQSEKGKGSTFFFTLPIHQQYS